MVLKQSQQYILSERFENDVKMYGTQTDYKEDGSMGQFENDVKMYGTQTVSEYFAPFICLRMM